MESLYLIIGIALAIWLLTTKKFRKQIGDNATHSVSVASKTLVGSLESNRLASVLDFKEELQERGTDWAEAKEDLKAFDELFGIK